MIIKDFISIHMVQTLARSSSADILNFDYFSRSHFLRYFLFLYVDLWLLYLENCLDGTSTNKHIHDSARYIKCVSVCVFVDAHWTLELHKNISKKKIKNNRSSVLCAPSTAASKRPTMYETLVCAHTVHTVVYGMGIACLRTHNTYSYALRHTPAKSHSFGTNRIHIHPGMVNKTPVLIWVRCIRCKCCTLIAYIWTHGHAVLFCVVVCVSSKRHCSMYHAQFDRTKKKNK